MRILITNDDGIHGAGLKSLEKIARHFTDDVWISVPDIDQSGASHSLTLREPLRIRRVEPHKFAITGTPTDSVLLGAFHLLKDLKPTLVLSGVNDGGNLAEEITYSGTVAGAIEGTLIGIPSYALSLVRDSKKPAQWETAEEWGVKVLSELLKLSFPPHVLININFPDIPSNEIQGIKATTQGHRKPIADNLVERLDPRGKPYYWIGGGQPYESLWGGEEGTDLQAISQGFVSVTPLSLNLTHPISLNKIREVF